MSNIRMAVISSSKAQRIPIEQALKTYGLEVVFRMGDFKTGYKELVRVKKPDILFVNTDFPETSDGMVGFGRFIDKVKRDLPEMRIVVRTRLGQDHPKVQEAEKNGINIIDERADFSEIATLIAEASTSQEGQIAVKLYNPRSHDLDTYKKNWFHGEKEKK